MAGKHIKLPKPISLSAAPGASPIRNIFVFKLKKRHVSSWSIKKAVAAFFQDVQQYEASVAALSPSVNKLISLAS